MAGSRFMGMPSVLAESIEKLQADIKSAAAGHPDIQPILLFIRDIVVLTPDIAEAIRSVETAFAALESAHRRASWVREAENNTAAAVAKLQTLLESAHLMVGPRS
jgi:hypothetical protein